MDVLTYSGVNLNSATNVEIRLIAALSRSNRAFVLCILCHPGALFERQVLVNKRNGHATLAHAAGNALDGTMTHVAGAENTG